MSNKPKTNPFKGTTPPAGVADSPSTHRRTAIYNICDRLSESSSSFDDTAASELYELIKKYCEEYQRWFYSDITNYLLNSIDDPGNYNTNLDKTHEYALKQVEEKKELHSAGTITETELQQVEQLIILIDKFRDHSNLAQRQKAVFGTTEEDFKQRFDVHAAPYADKISRELNQQLISLIAIFTALSFIVFGGISSLDNIFADANSVPIIELAIVGCIWGLCIMNLVFSFVFFISKLTKISIKSNEDQGASLSQRYPFWVWSNFVILFLLVVFGWIYFIDYSNSGSWLVALAQGNSFWFTILGTIVIGIIFGSVAVFVTHSSKKSK